MKVIEKLEKLFKQNEEWHDYNWTTPGNENPYPRKIQSIFIPHFNGKYRMTVTHFDKWGRSTSEVVDADTLWDATYHAWFDCDSIEGCIRLLEVWVRDFYEDYYRCRGEVDRIEVKSELRRKEK